jgi:hypothetical protein
LPPAACLGKHRNRQSACDGLCAAVDALAHFLARLEVRHAFGRDGYRLASLGIAADARWTMMQGKAAETPDLDAFILGQALADVLEQQLDRQFNVLVGQVGLTLSQSVDEFGFGHLHTPMAEQRL